VRKLFKEYATGKYTLEQIQKLALSLGLVSRRSKKILALSRIQRMLQNPFYYGLFQFKGETYEGIHEPAISRQLFEKVQRVLRDRGKPRKEKASHNFGYLGIFKCGECGRSITAEQHKKKSGLVFRYYRCTKKNTDCKQGFVNEKNLNSQINDIFQKVALPLDWLKPILAKLDEEEKEISQSKKSFAQNLENEVSEIENKLSRILDMQLENTITLSEYKEKKEKLLNQKTALKEKLADFGRKGNCWLEPIRNFILSAHQANFLEKSENLEERRSFLQKIGSNWTLQNKTLAFQAQKEWKIALKKSQFSEWSG